MWCLVFERIIFVFVVRNKFYDRLNVYMVFVRSYGDGFLFLCDFGVMVVWLFIFGGFGENLLFVLYM